jgi:putative ABC transport system substrate-binding protein
MARGTGASREPRRAWQAAVVVLLLAFVPLAAGAQPAARLPRVGLIEEATVASPYLGGFRQGLRELGYVEGRNIVVEYRDAQGDPGRVARLVGELVRLDVDVLVVGGTASALSASRVTTTVPIVFTRAGDPVGSGIVASLDRPGGNVTGLSDPAAELSGKQLEILKTAAPHVARVGVLYNPGSPISRSALEGARTAARTLGLELQAVDVRQPDDLDEAFDVLVAWRAGAVLALSDPVIGSGLKPLASLAAQHRLPAIASRREFTDLGGLLAYGPNLAEHFRLAAGYVDRILKGARPANLPVQQPTAVELAVTLKTAKALGLTIPQTLLLRADRTIE